MQNTTKVTDASFDADVLRASEPVRPGDAEHG